MTDPRSTLPAVHVLLDEAAECGILDKVPRGIVAESIRAVLDTARLSGAVPPLSGWMEAVREDVETRLRPSLVRVINATGVVLHTNLGRAPLAPSVYATTEQAVGPCSLEFDLETGERGSRQKGIRSLLREITGAEDGFIVTNAAAALLLLLNTLADEGETIVSRGELVEIGGSFRIPEILRKSGSTLVEVGATNRTRIRDYELALSPRSRLLLKVHRSNFRLVGFTEETPLEEMVALGDPHGIPTVHDAGSGLLLDLSRWGLRGEPLIQDSVSVGSTVVFSGDKLVGGPQAGILVGPTAVVERAMANPLARALRPDKMTLAAMEATLTCYRDPDTATSRIPTISMLIAEPELLARRAENLAELLPGATTVPGFSTVGGGAFPGVDLPTTLVTLAAESPQTALAGLRHFHPPVIARAADGAVQLDVRTVRDGEFSDIRSAVELVFTN